MRLQDHQNLARNPMTWSAEMYRVLGCTQESVPAPNFEIFLARVHPDDRQRLLDNCMQAIADERPWQIEYRLIRADGSGRIIQDSGEVIFDSGGKPLSMHGALVDISARKQAENTLKSAVMDAEMANNAKSRFLAAASHDLRQPLTALTLYSGALVNHVGPAGRSMLMHMKECIGSLSELLTDLLDLSKLEAGVVIPSPRDFSLGDELAHQASAHAPEAAVKGLRLHCCPTARMVHTDPVLLRRLLGNLVENAIQHTEQGGVLVACRRRQGRTWVEVWDTGIGIPADKIGEIFEEFRQLGDVARNRGSGLGLAIVARTATLLGLEIRVRSRVGRGSMFAVEVPHAERQEIPPPVVPQERDYRPLRIALVEDNDAVRLAIVLALRGIGHQVVAAATGRELRAKLGTVVPDILVSDYRLPKGETGLDVISAMRTVFGTDLPAVLITGDTDPGLLRSMADRGIAIQHKPVDLETLVACLEALTQQKQFA